eukprot:2035163-Rhodomonas_salina.3
MIRKTFLDVATLNHTYRVPPRVPAVQQHLKLLTLISVSHFMLLNQCGERSNDHAPELKGFGKLARLTFSAT